MTALVCPDCEASGLAPWHGFKADCPGCRARAVSRGPNFARCLDARQHDDAYVDELERVGTFHDHVWRAYKADAINNPRKE